jgi:hypothetical protein
MTACATSSSAPSIPEVMLPMCVIRRLDAVLEPTKQQLLDTY